MGGGDLNSKKSWHPNTIKNQERVWKAEQAAAGEKKRIVELQRERAQERDRAELNELAKQSVGQDDNRLHWMYDKPDKKGHQEDYLLGRAIDKNYDKAEQEPAIPAVGRRAVGSSMLNVGGDTQVDLARKVREDPLILIKERERAARAALLNNPLHRRKITELLKKDQEQQKELKSKNKNKGGNDLDSKLAEKLNALGGKNSVDLVALLASDSSSDSSSEIETPKKKKKKKVKKSKKSKKKKKCVKSDSESEPEVKSKRHDDFDIKPLPRESVGRKNNDRNHDRDPKIKKHLEDEKNQQRPKSSSKQRRSGKDHARDKSSERLERSSNFGGQSRKRRNSSSDGNDESPNRKKQSYSRDKRDNSREQQSTEASRLASKDTSYHSRKEGKTRGRKEMGAAEAAARVAEMAAAGAEREQERAARVARQRAAAELEPPPGAARRPRAALPDSLEARIHSNRHYIQRDQRHMDTHFARR